MAIQWLFSAPAIQGEWSAQVDSSGSSVHYSTGKWGFYYQVMSACWAYTTDGRLVIQIPVRTWYQFGSGIDSWFFYPYVGDEMGPGQSINVYSDGYTWGRFYAILDSNNLTTLTFGVNISNAVGGNSCSLSNLPLITPSSVMGMIKVNGEYKVAEVFLKINGAWKRPIRKKQKINGVWLPSSSITVSYPVGTICSCSNGTTTYTATDTSGSYVFYVGNGDWIVSITDGTQVGRSQTFTIENDYTYITTTVAFTATITVYGGATETITYTGASEGSFTTNENGIGTAELPIGTYEFTAGLSKRTGSATLSGINIDLYLRPQSNCAYWFGVKIDGTWATKASASIVEQTNCLYGTTRRTSWEGLWVNNLFTGASKVKALIKRGDNIHNNNVALAAVDKWSVSAQSDLDTMTNENGYILMTRDIDTAETQGYGLRWLSSSSGVYSGVYVYAIWGE